MGHFLPNICHTYNVILDQFYPVCSEASIFLSTMDVHVQRGVEETFSLFQALVDGFASLVFFTTFWQQDQKWETSVIGLSRILANVAFADRSRHPSQVGTYITS